MSVNNVNRPASSIQKMLDKVISLSNFTTSTFLNQLNSEPSSAAGTSTTTNELEDNHDQKFKLSKITCYNLFTKVKQLIKFESKSKNLQFELNSDFLLWSSSVAISNIESLMIIKQFVTLLSSQIQFKSNLIDKFEKIKLSLYNIHQREKKYRNLINLKHKYESELKVKKNKFGPRASNTVLIFEKLEETNISLQVVEQQLIKSIITDLKESLIDFAIHMNYSSQKLQLSSDEFIQYLNNLENNNNENHNGNEENEIAKISPNKYQHQKKRTANELKHYDLPTPQSLCNDCKRPLPCLNHGLRKPPPPQQESPIRDASYGSSDHWN